MAERTCSAREARQESATSGDGSRHQLVAKAVYEIAMRLACVIAHPVLKKQLMEALSLS